MIRLAENSYGKSRVRVVRVKRHANRHELREWTVEILLEGDFESCFLVGDNSKILPTDTMKNTVYSLARESAATCIEEFGTELSAFLLKRNPQVNLAQINLCEKDWQPLQTAGAPHPTTFLQSSGELQTAQIVATRDRTRVQSGLGSVTILKTAGSEFAGFLRDSLTTLPETTDRLLGTALQANWSYRSTTLPFNELRRKIRELLLSEFAGHVSKSVQHTLYAMGQKALENVPEVDDIELAMPNKHCLLVDLSRFGQDNPNEIFVPIDEPHGQIQARLCRKN